MKVCKIRPVDEGVLISGDTFGFIIYDGEIKTTDGGDSYDVIEFLEKAHVYDYYRDSIEEELTLTGDTLFEVVEHIVYSNPDLIPELINLLNNVLERGQGTIILNKLKHITEGIHVIVPCKHNMDRNQQREAQQ